MTAAPDPRRVLLEELTCYYNIDELPEALALGLVQQADSSAAHVVHVLGYRAVDVVTILLGMSGDRDHALFDPLEAGTLIDWNHDETAWPLFQEIARGMIDGIVARTAA